MYSTVLPLVAPLSYYLKLTTDKIILYRNYISIKFLYNITFYCTEIFTQKCIIFSYFLGYFVLVKALISKFPPKPTLKGFEILCQMILSIYVTLASFTFSHYISNIGITAVSLS
jgi:hypothetical protein